MNLGNNQKVALMTTDFSRGRLIRGAAIAVFLMLPQLPLPEASAVTPYLDWVSNIGAVMAGLLTTTAATRQS